MRLGLRCLHRCFSSNRRLIFCASNWCAHSSASSLAIAAPRRGLADWQVKKVTTYMRAHLDEDISLDDLAALVSLSRFHFCTAFRLATGRTPHEWLVGQRIGRSRMLLTNPTLPVTEIALMVGYQTPSSFAAAFHRQVGVSPSEFRRQL